jgi:hypothetical protein
MTVAIPAIPRSAKICVKLEIPYQPRRVASSTLARSYVRSMLLKLGLRDRTQRVIAAYESGFVWAETR